MQKTHVLNEKLKRQTRGQAIRTKCLDCCCDSVSEVKKCEIKKCSLWPYRMGYEMDFNGERIKPKVVLKE